jgi:hypothetical protein
MCDFLCVLKTLFDISKTQAVKKQKKSVFTNTHTKIQFLYELIKTESTYIITLETMTYHNPQYSFYLFLQL